MLYIPEQIKNLSNDWMDYQYQISIKSATKNLKLEKELITKFKNTAKDHQLTIRWGIEYAIENKVKELKAAI